MGRSRLWTLTVVDLLVIWRCWPNFAALLTHLVSPRDWVSVIGADQAAVELVFVALWVSAVWLAVGLLITALAARKGRVGRLARVLAQRTMPTVMRRGVAGALGLSLALAPAATGAAGATTTTGAHRTAAHSSTSYSVLAGPDVGWPNSSFPRPGDARTSKPAPAPRQIPWPQTPPESQTPAQAPAQAPATGSRSGLTSDSDLVVAPGDSLWAIAARRLEAGATDRQVAAAWPSWFEANRDVIGTDPALIRPGEHLRAPKPRPT